jgi:hypothetical protein
MIHAAPKADVGHSIMRSLKELYLSIFVLFFRISRWRGSMKARTAAAGLTIVEGLLAVSLSTWVAAATHQLVEVNRWIIGGAFVVLYLLNDQFLVDQGRGVAFEKQFSSFPAAKRTVLYLAAIGIVLATGIALYLSVVDYHQTFTLPRK